VRSRTITLAAVLSVAVPAAHADNALRPERIPNKARELADKGRRHHEAGDYAAAVSAFKEAYVLAPSPGLLFNIAQAYRLGGNCDEASWMYRRFLDTNPQGKHRALAENHLAVTEKCGSGGLRITVTPPRIDAQIPEPPSPASTTSTESLSIGRSVDDSKHSKLKRAGMYTVAGGGVALLGAAMFALDAAEASNKVEDIYARGGKWNDVKDVNARGERSAKVATLFGVGGGVAVLSGAIMYGLGRHYEKARYVAVTPTKQGAQVSLSWGF